MSKRWQDPAILIRSDVKRPYYFIRPYIPVPGTEGMDRKQRPIRLAFVDEKPSERKLMALKQEAMAAVNQGKFLLQAQIRFKELVEKYREARLPKLEPATRERYESHLANHILPVFGKLELADINRQAIEAWLNREGLKHEHGEDEYEALGYWSLWSLRGIMSASFTAAIEWGLWQGVNPCRGVKLGQKIEKREKRIPSAADLQRFLAAIPETDVLQAESARAVVLTAVAAGLRVSEVLGLQVDDVDPLNGTLTVARKWRRGAEGPVKSASARRVRQIGPLAKQLADIGRGRHYIFEREPGMPPDDRDLQRYVIRPAAEAVGIYHEGFGMHVFRRLNVSWRQEAGATPFEAQKAAGHAKPEMTWLYTITDAEREKQHVEAIWARVMPEQKGGVM